MTIRKAVLFMLLSTLTFSVLNMLVKSFVYLGPFEMVFFRAVGSTVLATTYLRVRKIPLLGNNPRILIIRSVVGLIAISFFYHSMTYLQVGTAVTLRYISPIFATLVAMIWLREQIKLPQWSFFLLAFAGVVVIKGFDPNIHPLGFVYALCAAGFSGMVYVIIRKIGQSEHPLVIVNYFMAISTLISGLLAAPNWIWPETADWPKLLSLGVLGLIAQWLMTRAFQGVATNIAAPLKYFEVVFTVLLGIFFFGEVYTWWSVLGMGLIIGGLMLNIWYKSRGEKDESPETRLQS